MLNDTTFKTTGRLHIKVDNRGYLWAVHEKLVGLDCIACGKAVTFAYIREDDNQEENPVCIDCVFDNMEKESR